jgi:mycofactocin precursor
MSRVALSKIGNVKPFRQMPTKGRLFVPQSAACRRNVIGIMEISCPAPCLSFLLYRQRKKAYNVDDWSKEDQRVNNREETEIKRKSTEEADRQEPDVLEEIEVEDFAVDGICGVY